MLYNVFSMLYEFHFGTLLFVLYFNFGISVVEIKINFGISVVEIKIKIRTCFSNHVFQTTQEDGG